MDGTNVALISTAIVASATVAAALITTLGNMKALNASQAKERLRDDIDRLQAENLWLRNNLAYVLRQAGAFHELENIYFRQACPGAHERHKSKARKEAEDACGVYPHMNRKQCFQLAEQIESGHIYLSIQPLSLSEVEKT